MTGHLGEVVSNHSLVLVAGAGGVGKTTVSAALGVSAAELLDGNVLVLTVDPARRLASALGVDIGGNEAIEVDLGARPRSGKLFAAMLDPGLGWDSMVEAEAPNAETAARIVANPVYRRIADSFVNGNDYAALGWLADAMQSDEYRLIIVDTPPSQSAVGLFDAPERVSEFFSSSLLGWLTRGQSGALVGGAAARTFGTIADRLLGSQFFGDIVEFFELMQDIVPGMVERTSRVAAELAGDDAAIVGVTAATRESIAKLTDLVTFLEERGLGLDAVVANGVEPEPYWDARVADVADRVLGEGKSPFSMKATALLVPGTEYVAARCDVAAAQAAALRTIPGDLVVSAPRTVHSPSAVEALAELGSALWVGEHLHS